jgi:hypothetical protein
MVVRTKKMWLLRCTHIDRWMRAQVFAERSCAALGSANNEKIGFMQDYTLFPIGVGCRPST